jgi:hypothetical protein
MLRIRGLTQFSLAVRDVERTLTFYVQVFGVREYLRDATSRAIAPHSANPKVFHPASNLMPPPANTRSPT